MIIFIIIARDITTGVTGNRLVRRMYMVRSSLSNLKLPTCDNNYRLKLLCKFRYRLNHILSSGYRIIDLHSIATTVIVLWVFTLEPVELGGRRPSPRQPPIPEALFFHNPRGGVDRDMNRCVSHCR